jgi:Carbohydrate binding domain (family 11)
MKEVFVMRIANLAHGLILASALVPVAARAAATDSAVVDDFEGGSNQNKFLAYTFYYADTKDGGNTTIASAKAPNAAGELLFDPTLSVGEGANGSAKSLKLDFKMGTTKPSCGTSCTYGNMAGVGTGFATDGSVLNLTGATSVTFWAKASAAMTMRVEIATKPVTNFGYHVFQAILTTSWMQYTLPLVEGPDFQQPAWAATADPQTFDPSQVEKIQFSISTDDNTGLTAGIVNIDQIVVRGYKWVPPTACMAECEKPGTGALLGDLEGATGNKNKSGGYWFAYNDAEGRVVSAPSEYSEIFEGVTPDTAAGSKNVILKVSPAKGMAGTAGALIGFKLGPTYLQGTEQIKPFVGIGTKVSDALGVNFSNYTGANAISFDYWSSATSTFEYIRVELKANQDYGNAGIVHTVLIPATGGTWKSYNIPFTKFKLPDWEEVALIPLAQQALKVAEMEKIQWAVQGLPGTTGSFAVDNVKIGGLVDPIPTIGGAPVLNSAKFQKSGFAVTQGFNQVHVGLRLGNKLESAQIRMVDMKGHVVASEKVEGMGPQSYSIKTQSLKSGVYTVQVKVGDRVMSAPVTLLP